MNMLKVFVHKDQVPAVLQRARLIARYDAFVVVEATDAAARALARTYPTEDITAQYQLELAGRRVNTLGGRPAGGAKAVRVRAAPARRAAPWTAAKLAPGPHHYIVQFVGPIKRAWLAGVRATGAALREPYGGFGYVVNATEAQLAKIAALKSVLWIGHLPHADRLAPGLAASGKASATLPRRRAWPGAYRVEIFDSGAMPRIAREARSLGFKVLSQEPRARVLTVQTDAGATARRNQLKALSAVHGVRFIRERVLARPSNNIATTIMANAYTALSASGLKLSGAGEIVAICDTGLDTGDPATIHPDFAGRVAIIKSYPITSDWSSVITNPGANDGPADLDSGHGTHVAGSVLGNGAASANGPALIRGHAYEAKLVFQAVEQEMDWRPSAPKDLKSERYVLAGIPSNLAPLFQFAYDQGARVHSNSWGGGDPGAYDDQCRQFDDFVWKHKDFCFVIAAGNDGTDSDGNGKINPMSVTSPGTAKNCITLGACENRRPDFNGDTYGEWWPDDFPVAPFHSDPMANNPAQVVPFSSRGPTADGRVKPDVVAPGTFILSTRSTQIAPNNFAWAAYPPNKKYFYMGGTSMATPLTAGAVALVREFLRTKKGIAKPSAALVKALVVAGAQRLPGPAPAGTLLDNDQGYGRVNLDRSLRRAVSLVEGNALATGQSATLKINVPTAGKTLRIALAYSDFPGDKLVNNLNLVVADPSGKGFVGNQAGSGSGTLAMDKTNNVEVVEAKKAKKGSWTIDVIASNVPSGPQDYALAVVLV
jgi:subtilisin family serine protease